MGSGIKIYFKLKISDTHKLVDPELFEKETSENMDDEVDIQTVLTKKQDESFAIGEEEEAKVNDNDKKSDSTEQLKNTIKDQQCMIDELMQSKMNSQIEMNDLIDEKVEFE